MSDGLVMSIHDRLLDIARQRGDDFNRMLNRYAVERFLYRLSTLPAREDFLLKGSLLFDLWFSTPHRPTRDADFLGFGAADAETLAETMCTVCRVEASDGLVFDAGSVTVEEIREQTRYGGLRVKLSGTLGSARCRVQLDVGFGDVVTPGPLEADYPTLLTEQPAPRLRVYPRATVVAEKLEAIVSLGMANTRLKDYYDLLALAREGALPSEDLATAITATFARRGTAVPVGTPPGLSDAFALDPAHVAQWKAFLGRNRIEAPPLDATVAELRAFLEPPLSVVKARESQGRE